MRQRKLRPIDEGGQAEELRVVRSGRTLFMCPQPPPRRRGRWSSLLEKAQAILHRIGISGTRAA